MKPAIHPATQDAPGAAVDERVPRARAEMGWLLAAQAVSICGTRMSMVALPWFVLVTTGSPLRTGIVAFAEMLPYVVVSVLAAPVTDRLGARRTSIVCDVGSLLAVGAIPLLHETGALGFPGLLALVVVPGATQATGALGFPGLLALVVVAGGLRGPGDNAKHVLLPAAAERAGMSLERASGLYDGVNRAAGLVGAPLAGVLIGVIGAADVLFVDAATFLVAAVLVAIGVVAGGVHADEEEDGTPYRARVAAGLRFLRRDHLLLAIAVMLFLTNLLDQAFVGVLLPVWSRDQGHGALGVGLMQGAFGVGATVGALAMALAGDRLPRRITFLVCFLLAGCPRFFASGMDAPLGVVLVVGAIGGLAAGGLNPILAAVELERIPVGKRARVLAAMTAVAWGGIPLGGLAGGWLVDLLGVTGALFGCGAVYLAATLLPLGRTWRAMDRAPVGAASG